jgi:hypothetical protein
MDNYEEAIQVLTHAPYLEAVLSMLLMRQPNKMFVVTKDEYNTLIGQHNYSLYHNISDDGESYTVRLVDNGA